MEIYNRQFKEVEPGLYLPFEQEVTHYIGREMGMEESLLGKPLYHFRYCVDDFQIGTLDDTARAKLVLQPSIGTSVLDLRTDDRYTITDKSADPFAGPIGQGVKARRFVVIRALFIIAGSALILISVWFKLRKKDK